MGLLDKALKDRESGPNGKNGGLLTKAAVSHARQDDLSVNAAVKTPANTTRLASKLLSEFELRQLAAETAGLAPGETYIFRAFARIAEANSYSALALCLADGMGLHRCANLGFEPGLSHSVSLSALKSVGNPGIPVSASGPESIGALLSLHRDSAVRAVLIRTEEGRAIGAWLYADQALDEAERSLRDAASTVFPATLKEASLPPETLGELSRNDAITALLAQAQDSVYATAVRIALKQPAKEAERWVPGIEHRSVDALIASAARRVLGAWGSAFHVEGSFLFALFKGPDLGDHELVAVQVCKSIARAIDMPLAISRDSLSSLPVEPTSRRSREDLARFFME